MKNIVLFFALMLSTCAFAQTRKTTPHNVKGKKNTTKVVVPTKKINLDYQDFEIEYDKQNKSFRLNTDSTGLGYAVISAPGYSQKELFQKVILGLNNIYTDIDKVVTKIEYDAITINAVENPENTMFKAKYWEYPQQVEKFKYRISIKIKDNKVRIDTPIVSSIWTVPFFGDKFISITDFKEVDDDTDPIVIRHYVENILKRILKESLSESHNDDW